MEAGADTAQEAADMAQATIATAVDAADEAAKQALVSTVVLADRPIQDAANLMNQASEHFQAVARSNGILARGAATLSLEWAGLRQERLLKNLDRMNDLLRCRSMQDVVSLQHTVAQENFRQVVENGRRLAQLTAQVAQEATRTITAPSGRDRLAP